jgi:hypothetical protein
MTTFCFLYYFTQPVRPYLTEYALSIKKSLHFLHDSDHPHRKMANYSFDVIPAHKDNVTVSVDDFNKHPNDYFDVCHVPFER